MNEERKNINSFVTGKVQNGVDKTSIREQLTAVGWSEDEIDAAYARALVSSGVPVPEEGNRGTYTKKASTVEVVLNFFSFILLGIVVTALGSLYFALINYYFPDALRVGSSYYYRAITDMIHYATAALVIGFPLYYVAVRLWFKKFREDEARVESKLTKWVTYLVLLAASVTIVGDLISVVYTFLQGEITARFFLKALTVLTIAGMIFGFYYLERKKVQYRSDIPRDIFQKFGYFLSAIVVIGIVLGFMVSGSPATERMRGFDEQRARDLNSLANCVNSYTQQYQRLPDTLSELEGASNFSYCARKRDPETKSEYEYRIITPVEQTNTNVAEGVFELCADFSLANDGGVERQDVYYNGIEDTKWAVHEKGRACDTETVAVRTVRPLTPVPAPF